MSLAPVVIYSGRFQPFHPGHYAVWRWLVERWGPEAVRIGTSDRKTQRPGDRPAPLSFDEKRRVITTLFDVPASAVVCVASPYRPVEALVGLDPSAHAYIAAVGEKDATRLASRPYFRPLPEAGPLEPFPSRGYVQVVPASPFPRSGSEIRELLRDPDKSYAEKRALFLDWYGSAPDELVELLITRFAAG